MKAREVTSDEIQAFLDGLRWQDPASDERVENLSASSVNHHRTMLVRIFNFAIERSTYDQNPAAVVHQYIEPPGRDRFATVGEFQKLLEKCGDDLELRTAVCVWAMTTLRKMELLSRRWDEIDATRAVPYVSVLRTKNRTPKKIPLPDLALELLRQLPSYGASEYVFPSRPTGRFPKPKRPYRWDLGERFREACRAAGIRDLRIHDLSYVLSLIMFLVFLPAFTSAFHLLR